MSDPFMQKLADGSLKCANYWQSVLRFGLPWMVLYDVIDYRGFRLSTGNVGLRYHWRITIVAGVPVMFIVSTIWWALMREIASWKQKNQRV